MTLITKKNIIIVLFGLIILLLPVIYWLNAGKNKTQTTELDNNKIIQNDSNYTDSTAPDYDTNIALYKIISVFPPDETQNIPLETSLTITFDQPVKKEVIEFSSNPAFPYEMGIKDNQLEITPKSVLEEGTKYTYIVKYKNYSLPSATYSFTTAGSLQNIPDTMPEGAAEAERLFQRENHPDVYLANFTPYDSGSFSVQSEFLSDTNLFRFTVIQKTSAAKDDFTNWLKSLQLSDQQIGTLDISY
ncbi:hypothetical protein A3D05_03720 [Candidatus Gottesmanbacteria bacterium RIFCSPHIGHO2_02_FULL_40_24]|uniref:SbsA Ig-like domain-containing protein n=1 Tax=Candidatus Gottesmanbacteria bacterium RIFCSPHIGHO2_01_FULL_40_15 TaxID=1798376 RepID=A0A1F5Z1J9_9BACT|nr:MAG: hypothetical protein A2777_06605 [Candidatus Gottesmanbacteria bacterium RIFCSPHIGHO2_01_FULL_40_15]OGG16988.1 MAG: hypothetical protein A3D05_03720 [Candidatus Gottesmanbacteria bacterium RIFCSPHIGHO2_02_FULL_40_24]OGG21152.1 MAG: hypothetical protein A3B48_03170 [Candidatus Gottesmanbacteria bacterium RIFCSPLOWO2_01_FULL_40_10]OGG31779.1 MAG: hypothetical protein A3I80_04455 [Candidatus Gottesmanbacteria bacterium RIFCSPLOWO2_02_FULL_40_10]